MNLFSHITHNLISFLCALLFFFKQLKALAALSVLLQQRYTKEIVLIVPQWVWIFYVFFIFIVICISLLVCLSISCIKSPVLSLFQVIFNILDY